MATTALAPFSQHADQLRGRIDDALEQFVDFGEGCPARLQEAIRYSLLSPGKRLRPLLVLFAAEACGSHVDDALPAACAVEMVHAYSLVHDDLPAMDDDDLRRGRATCHKKFGEAVAILVGDALLARAFELLGGHIQPPDVAAECSRTLAHAAGAEALVGGQADDLAREQESTGKNPPLECDALQSIHRRKTGALFNAAVRLGGVIGGADQEKLCRLRTYSENLGLAFQIVDDLLDAAGEEATVGKRVGKDAARGKLTYPELMGVKESRLRADALIDDACAALSPLGATAGNLESLARFVVERDR